MTAQEISQLLALLGAKSIVVDSQRGWVRSSCPFAPWFHEGGIDRRPSFGVKIPENESDSPYFTCFTCGSNGPLSKLISGLSHLKNDRLQEASEYLSRFPIFPEHEEKAATHRRIRVPDRFAHLSLSRPILRNLPVPARILDNYPPLWTESDLEDHAAALRWLQEERRISFQPVGRFKLRLYTNENGDVGVIFPILSVDGETVLDMWVRLIDRKKFFRLTAEMTKSDVAYKAPNLLFGNHLRRPEKSVLLVEGPLDALRLSTLGVERPLACLGGLSSEQINSFYARVVYLGFDNDEAGRQFTKKAIRALRVPSLSILDWGVVGKKDPGELESQQEFIDVFNARIKLLNGKNVKPRLLVTNRRKDDGGGVN